MRTTTMLLTLLACVLLSFDASAQKMPLVYDVENTCADCPKPPLPSFSQLPTIQSLPDVFMRSDTSLGRITNRSDWRLRRAEIGAEIERYEMGTKPPPPDPLEASFSADSVLTVTVTVGGKTLTLTSKITLPSGTGPFPAVIGVGTATGSLPSDIFTSRGIATIRFMESQITPGWSNVRGDGPFYEMYPDKKRGKFIAWAWGVSRIIDGLAKTSEANIDLKHLAITGCSYAGKIALFSGAFDERIALTIAIESGGGGYTAWRVTETLSGSRETLRNAQGQHWYSEDVSLFNNAVTKLPYDHHELMAMVAPRALFVTGNPSYEWLADESGHVGSFAAHQAWIAMGANDRFGFSIVGGHNHCSLPESQRPEVESFVEKFLLGNQGANTYISTTPYGTDLASWMKWSTPKLPEVPTSVGEPGAAIDRIELMQNYPNPFNPTTQIRYSVPYGSYITLKVYNLFGQEVATLVEGETAPGAYEVNFSAGGRFAFDGDAGNLPSGVYFYRLIAGSFVETKRLLLLK